VAASFAVAFLIAASIMLLGKLPAFALSRAKRNFKFVSGSGPPPNNYEFNTNKCQFMATTHCATLHVLLAAVIISRVIFELDEAFLMS